MTIHFGLTQEQMRAKAQSNGDFDGPNPACSSGDAHAVVTFDVSRVTCCACISKLAALNSYKTTAIAELGKKIADAGFRVFIARSGTYGFYTDAEGSRVVSFQYDLNGFKFSGNYKTDNPRQTGNGWELEAGSYREMFEQSPPSWAVGAARWKLSSLVAHLMTYQKSSCYTEFFVKGE